MADRPSQRVWELVYDYIARNIIPTMSQEAINEILNEDVAWMTEQEEQRTG